MKPSAQKQSRLRSRIAALDQEIGRLEGSIKELDRAVSLPDREAAARVLRGFNDRQQPKAQPPAAAAPEPPRPTLPAVGTIPPAPEPPLPDDALQAPRDNRFASYFVTGSLQSVRPLRMERNMQRNRAIVMAVVAVLMLYIVIRLLF